jgi:hypothetical protein
MSVADSSAQTRTAVEAQFENGYLDRDDVMTLGSDNSGSTCNCMVRS